MVKAEEFDAYLAHVGGSMQALADIDNRDIADLDENLLWSGAFNKCVQRLRRTIPMPTTAILWTGPEAGLQNGGNMIYWR